MEWQFNIKIDSKGRMCIPAYIREEIGDTATLKKTAHGYLIIPGEHQDAGKIVNSKHHQLIPNITEQVSLRIGLLKK